MRNMSRIMMRKNEEGLGVLKHNNQRSGPVLSILVVIVSIVRGIGRSTELGVCVLVGVGFVLDFDIFAGVMIGFVGVMVGFIGVSLIFVASIVIGVEWGC